VASTNQDLNPLLSSPALVTVDKVKGSLVLPVTVLLVMLSFQRVLAAELVGHFVTFDFWNLAGKAACFDEHEPACFVAALLCTMDASARF
jgi:hypothetical protein